MTVRFGFLDTAVVMLLLQSSTSVKAFATNNAPSSRRHQECAVVVKASLDRNPYNDYNHYEDYEYDNDNNYINEYNYINDNHNGSYNTHYYGNNQQKDLQEDWKTLTHAASNIARKVGSQALHALEVGGSRIADVVSHGANKVQDTLRLPSLDVDKRNSWKKESHNDRQQQLLFENVFNNNDVDVDDKVFGEQLPSTSFSPLDTARAGASHSMATTATSTISRSSSSSGVSSTTATTIPLMDQAMEDAVALLEQTPSAAELLGPPPLEYFAPFSQSTRTTTVNGMTCHTMEASFDIVGSHGKGVVFIVSNYGQLASLDLMVDGHMYRYNVVAAGERNSDPSNYFTTTDSSNSHGNTNPRHHQQRSAERNVGNKHKRNKTIDDKDDHRIIFDVEILDGIQRPKASDDGFLDVDIVDKRTI